LSLKSNTQKEFGFQSIESFTLFLEGIRALDLYEQETAKRTPSRAPLDRFLNRAYDNLEDCCLLYPDDRLPYFYLGITLTLKNQQDAYLKHLLKVEVKNALLAQGRFLFFRQEFTRSQSAQPQTAQLPSHQRSFEDAAADGAWYQKREREEFAKAGPYREMADADWTLLEQAEKCFQHIQSDGPADLVDTATYNLAQVYSRLGGKSIAKGTKALAPLKAKLDQLPPKSSDDDRALALQVKILDFNLGAREFLRFDQEPPVGSETKFEHFWKSLEEMPHRIENSGLTPSYRNDLRSDCLVKSGYVKYEQALSGRFTNDPIDCLDIAGQRFDQALKTRKSWNQAQLYLATVRIIQSGAAEAKHERAARARHHIDELLTPQRHADVRHPHEPQVQESADRVLLAAKRATLSEQAEKAQKNSEALSKSADDLFASLTGPPEEPAKQSAGLEG
jgi:hypothetical protein